MQIAEHIGGSVEEFAQMMNQKAKELNLINTHFVTPHGLDNPEHYTTPYELALLTDYALENNKFAELVNTNTYTISINGYPKTLNNTNELLGTLSGVNGVKTGFTNNAGRCLVTSTTRNGWQIIAVVLGADTKKIRTKDSINLIEYTFKNYELVNIEDKIVESFNKEKNKQENNLEIEKGKSGKVCLELGELTNSEYPIKKDEIKNLTCNIDVVHYAKAPIQKGTVLGSVELMSGEKTVCKVDVLCKETIEKKGIFDYFSDFCCNLGTYVTSI